VTSWIQTYTGRKFLPLEARVEDVDIRDIAHSLALLARFNGHCLRFYSVADHSVRVAAALAPEHAPWGLLHDAAEAYLSDLPRPVKQESLWFREVEDRLLQVVAQAFSLPWPVPDPVWRADDVLLATEARDLMAPAPEDWGLAAEPLPERIEPLGPEDAERAFLRTYARLFPTPQPGSRLRPAAPRDASSS